MDGIETLDDRARLKRKVLEAAKRAIVLNADDPRSAGMARDFPSVRKIFFSVRGEISADQLYVRGQDTAIFARAHGDREFIVLERDAEPIPLVAVDELPSCMEGIVRHNMANAMAAAGLAFGFGLSLETIADGLRRYGNSVEQSYGRFSFVDGFPMRVLFDRAVEAPAFETVTAAIDKIPAAGRRICALTGIGNRPDRRWPEAASAVAGHFDFYVCYERPEYLRGKRSGEIAEGLIQALVAAGVRPDCIVGASTSRARRGSSPERSRPKTSWSFSDRTSPRRSGSIPRLSSGLPNSDKSRTASVGAFMRFDPLPVMPPHFPRRLQPAKSMPVRRC